MLAPPISPPVETEADEVGAATLSGRILYQTSEQKPVIIPAEALMVDGQLDLYDEVIKGDYFRASFRGRDFHVQAGGCVGIIPLNDRVALDVRPRVPIDNLERLVNLAEHRPHSLKPHRRSYDFHTENAPALLDLLTDSLTEQIELVIAQGFLRKYEERSEATAFPRGRFDIDRTLRLRAQGTNHRVHTAWFEQNQDVAANRCLKYALHFLLRQYRNLRGDKSVRQRLNRLNRCYRAFEGVALESDKRFLRAPSVRDPRFLPANRAYYSDALSLAVGLIENRGVDFGSQGREFSLDSLLIRMDVVFEDYLREALSIQLASVNSEVLVLDGNKPVGPAQGAKKRYFDESPDYPLSEWATPDIMIAKKKGSKSAIDPQYLVAMDVKYKPKAKPERDDLNQVISYAASYKVSTGVLVMPCVEGESSGLTLIGRMGAIEIYHYAFDLSASDLQVEETLFAQHIATLCPKMTA